MNGAGDEQQGDATAPDDASGEAAARAQIAQRLQSVFRLAGDGDAARQLLRMIIEYRWRQTQ